MLLALAEARDWKASEDAWVQVLIILISLLFINNHSQHPSQ